MEQEEEHRNTWVTVTFYSCAEELSQCLVQRMLSPLEADVADVADWEG
jgi:hypothetical protein